MQLEGATELELRLYNLCRECEEKMPASDLETRIVVALSDAANELQEMRGVNVKGPRPFKSIEEAIDFLAWCTNVAPGIADSVPPMTEWDKYRLAWAKLMVCGIRSDR